MSRPLRVEYPGAVYHITSRGNERKSIFKSDGDRQLFLNILYQINCRFHWLCHSYALMDNHYHLLIETPEPNLSRGMRQLNGVFTQDFNRIHQRVGHLFQGRYKAIVVDKDAYLLEVSRYIVLNPVRAGIIKKPEEWKWSSYRALTGLEKVPDFLTVDWIRSQFGKDADEAKKAYANFVLQGIDAEYPDEAVTGQIILGDKRFIGTIAKQVNKSSLKKEIPRKQRYSTGTELDEIFQKGARQREKRETTIYRAYVQGGYTMHEIGKYLGLHYSSISLALRKHEKGQ